MKKKIFTLFWLTGDSQIVEGYDIANAITSAGYGGGAMGALDFWSPGDKREDYVWNKEAHTWRSKTLIPSF